MSSVYHVSIGFGFAYCFSFNILSTVAICTACGRNTSLDETSDSCICNAKPPQGPGFKEERKLANDYIRLLGLFDIENWDWSEELFDYTMSMLNDQEDGWQDDILANGTLLDWDVKNAACDGTKASRAYWSDRENHSGVPPHGLVGCRCSAASISVARVAGLEGVPQISPSSTIKQLGDKSEFPFFARTVSSDIFQTNAVVATLRGFDWDRVSILNTNTAYSTGLSTSFQQLWTGDHNDESGEWEGEIAYSHTIVINQDESVDEESVRQALNGVPTDDPINNARVILLLAHDHHAFSVLKIAAEMNFQPDTIWIGFDAWTNRYPHDMEEFMAAYPPDVHPGYLGITPYVNRNENYFKFLYTLQEAQSRDGKMPWPELLDHAAQQLVDSILALVMALAATPIENRRDGNDIMSRLIDLDFDGVSGRVRFTANGDRANPRFSIFNFRRTNRGGTTSWVDVGNVGSKIGSESIDVKEICFAVAGCGLDSAPNDSYPAPPDKLARWVPIVISVIVMLLISVTCKYFLVARKKKALASQMTEIQKKMDAMKNIDNELIDIDQVVEEAKKRQASLIMKRAALQDNTPATWSDSTDTLVHVSPEDEEYWSVLEKMRLTLPDVFISKLWRVQNSSLWSYYSFHKDRLEMNNIQSNERRVWHGTSSLDPSVVYNDQMDGFMMQFAAQGLWGRGIYFADKASYSRSYSHSPATISPTNDRPKPKKGELEMFLARLLVGKEAKLDQNRLLTVPPTDSSTGLKYNSVTGHTAGSQVWIVYENGRAYPEYLVRYYVGRHDKSRSPYESKEEAKKNRKWRSCNFELDVSTESNSQSNTANSHGFWEYQSDSGWVAYDATNQALIEKTFQDFSSNAASSSTVVVKGPEWEYEVDVDKKVQTNVQHASRTQRNIRFHPA